MTDARKFDSVQDYLEAEGFKVNTDFYVKGDVKFPVEEIMGHTPNTFAQKAREHGWVGWIGDGIDDAISDEVKSLFPDGAFLYRPNPEYQRLFDAIVQDMASGDHESHD